MCKKINFSTRDEPEKNEINRARYKQRHRSNHIYSDKVKEI